MTLAAKITFVVWFLYSLTSLVTYTIPQWLVTCAVGVFIFVFPVQIISLKVKNQKKCRSERISEQEKVYLEYEEALNNMGKSFSEFFKEVYFVDTELVRSDSSENYYLFTYKAKTKDQLNYLLSNQNEMFEKLDGSPVFKVLFDTTFHMKIKHLSESGESENYEKSSDINYFDYMGGHEFEYFCADLLKNNGFMCVEVTQGSGDHGIDILAEKDDITYAIQCKCYSKDIGNSAIQQAHTGKSIYKKDVSVVMTNRDFTPQAKEEAEALGVKLWNRDKLLYFINNSKTD